MLKVLATIVAAVALSWAGSAGAATVTIGGSLVAEGSAPYVDPNLAVGDAVTATVEFNPYTAMQLGTTGLFLAQATTFNMTAGSLALPYRDALEYPFAFQYYETNCEAEQGPGCSHTDEYRMIEGPAILFKGSKVMGLVGFTGIYNLALPDYNLGSYVRNWSSECKRQAIDQPYVCADDLASKIEANDTFEIYSNQHNGIYKTQGFNGAWDFAGASISGVPEPTTWAMMILGFGLAGSALRRRQSQVALLR
ncbi:PEPxxWA-CTERM sorting domain-containing protein [Phenylobacterium sp.]|uniref:PEPxxWA-CTERM sorting domain-containing protein n=1 Tax=Phenylobacterium sp. TaxID=1871053 RepID=UPI00286A36DE|nr:PEPxxWA-CTERM sorting domain-containing protein [Phenylobacterium sp.]